MANTWRATAQGVTFASAKEMLGVFQAGAGSRVQRIYRMFQFNNQTVAITGVLTTMQVQRISSASGGTSVTPETHDTSNSALSDVTAGHARTVGLAALFRQYMWSNDEPGVSAGTIDEWELAVPFAEIWNSGYGDATVQPLTARPGQGYSMYHSGSTAVGVCDLEIEFTDAAT